MLFWATADDVKTALETIEERCRLAFQGVPNETRKGLADGTHHFRTRAARPRPHVSRHRLGADPGRGRADRARARRHAAVEVHARLAQFREWRVPADTFAFLLKHNLAPLLEKIRPTSASNPASPRPSWAMT